MGISPAVSDRVFDKLGGKGGKLEEKALLEAIPDKMDYSMDFLIWLVKKT